MKQQKMPSEVPPVSIPERSPEIPKAPNLPVKEPEIIPEHDPKPGAEPHEVPKPEKNSIHD